MGGNVVSFNSTAFAREDADESQRLVAGISIPNQGDPKWRARYSDFDQYRDQDRFNEEILRSIENRLERSKIWVRLQFGFTYVALFLFFGTLYLALFDPNALNSFPKNDGEAIEWLHRQIVRWLDLSKAIPENKFVTSLVVLAIVTFVGQWSLSISLWNESKVILERIQELSRRVNGMRQIYPGSGKIQFSYGNEGILIFGTSLCLFIDWQAVVNAEDLTFLMILKSEVGQGRRRWFRPEIVNDVKKATHLLVILKPGKESEYLVIPRHFFDEGKSSDPWDEFVNQLYKAKREFDLSRKRPLPAPTL
jgi:hypothetical protein